MKKVLLLQFIFIVFIFVSSIKANVCSEKMIYDGFENVIDIGIDTTGHYWILTQPSEGYVRLIVDGNQSDQYKEIRGLTFSNDGKRWACFVRDNVTWKVMTNDTIMELFCDNVVNIGFSPNSEVLYYAYKEGSEISFVIGRKKVRGTGATGDIYLSWGAERYAIGAHRGDKYIYQVNGWETPPYEEINPLGFWNDGSFIYIVKIGNNWEIYKDKESISESFMNISEYAMNIWGTAAGFLARRSQSTSVGVLMSDEYYEPLITKSYESVSDLALHPSIDLMAFKARYNNSDMIVMSSTEYAGGQQTGPPQWTHDGSQLVFSACATDCFINVDGRRYNLNQMFDLPTDYAHKPHSKTIAYSTSTSLVVRNLESKALYAGKMMDYIIKPIFSWRHDVYLTLGVIQNRVYLMKCRI